MRKKSGKNRPGSFIFQNFKNPNGKSLDLWVRIQFVQKKFLRDSRFYRLLVLKFCHVTTFSAVLTSRLLSFRRLFYVSLQ